MELDVRLVPELFLTSSATVSLSPCSLRTQRLIIGILILVLHHLPPRSPPPNPSIDPLLFLNFHLLPISLLTVLAIVPIGDLKVIPPTILRFINLTLDKLRPQRNPVLITQQSRFLLQDLLVIRASQILLQRQIRPDTALLELHRTFRVAHALRTDLLR
uniref:(northern house mosquito) hypothetical protein n=1 Tax=Culex pipiens TaxID=7175 RepID=A0A8D8CN11_CULPI